MRLAAQRPLLPALQRMLLHTPLGIRGASARAMFRFYVRLPRLSGESVALAFLPLVTPAPLTIDASCFTRYNLFKLYRK